MEKIEKFKSQIRIESDGCHIWTGGKCRGYAIFGKVRAARWLYEYVNGAISPEKEISHICHNPSCVRLHKDHVVIETHAENMKRAAARGSWDGVKNSQSKLKEFEVILIRRLFRRRGDFPILRLSEIFGICPRSVYNVATSETYSNIDPDQL